MTHCGDLNGRALARLCYVHTLEIPHCGNEIVAGLFRRGLERGMAVSELDFCREVEGVTMSYPGFERVLHSVKY